MDFESCYRLKVVSQKAIISRICLFNVVVTTLCNCSLVDCKYTCKLKHILIVFPLADRKRSPVFKLLLADSSTVQARMRASSEQEESVSVGTIGSCLWICDV